MLDRFKYLYIAMSIVSGILSADAVNDVSVKQTVHDLSNKYDSNDEYPCWDLIAMIENHPELREVFDTTALYKKCAARSDALYQVKFASWGTACFMPVTKNLIRDGHKDNAEDLYGNLRWAESQSKIYHIADAQKSEVHRYQSRWKEAACNNLNKALQLLQTVQLLANHLTCVETTPVEEQQMIERIQNFDFTKLEHSIVTSLNRIVPHLKSN
jgi:hypothetical protein